MISVRGFPTSRQPNTNHNSTQNGKSSGWDRINNKHTPEQLNLIRDKWNEFYPDDPLIPQPKYQKTSEETQKEYLRRMWNVVFPDDQIDWDNFIPHPLPDLWVRFYLDFVSEEEMFRQDQEEHDDDMKYTPEQEMELWYQYLQNDEDENYDVDGSPRPILGHPRR